MHNLTCVEDQYGLPNCISCNATASCPSDNSLPTDSNHFVCGVDGNTYRSSCELKRLACMIGRSIAIAHKGSCKGKIEF